MQLLQQHIEALIFTAEQPISADELLGCLKTVYNWDIKKDQFREIIQELKEKYTGEEFSFELREIADGYQFLTKKEYHTAVNALLQIKARKRLSTAALETLAIIAYKQPISKSEIEHIRGVNCDYSIQKLLEKELVTIEGKGDGPGKPLLYGTSKNFMDHFGLKSVKDLPKLKDLHIMDNEIGIPSDLLDALDAPVELEPGEYPLTEEVHNEADQDVIADENETSDSPDRNENAQPGLEQHLQNGTPDEEKSPS